MGNQALRVGFVGLGIMGKSMAANCLKAGFELTVYNRTPGKDAELLAGGASSADSPASVARASDVVVTCVTGPDDVLEVVLDQDTGIIAGLAPGGIVVECSTVSPDVARTCSQALEAGGCGFLDAPVSGGDVGARQGTLSIMVGGEPEHFELAAGVLDAMGRTITHCGGPGAGYTVKLCNQILGGLHLLAAAEAINLAKASGLDLSAMLQAVSGGAAGSWILSNLGPKMASGDDEPGFFIDYQLKDLRLAQGAARQLGLPLPGTALAETLFTAASGQGLGKCGTQSLFRTIESLGTRS